MNLAVHGSQTIGPGPTPDSHPPAAQREPVGEIIAEAFEILALLGRGGMGEVYLARDLELGRHVALKLLEPLSGDDARRARVTTRFHREARATARLCHPNIVMLHQAGIFAERPFLVLERLEGLTLKAIDHPVFTFNHPIFVFQSPPSSRGEFALRRHEMLSGSIPSEA